MIYNHREMKLRQVTLCLLVKNGQVLLAMKKRGFGMGKWNGVGGKVKDGESLKEAVVRESQEEIGVTPLAYRKVAVLDFLFPEIPRDKDWNQQVVVFMVDDWEGEPTESKEMNPRWFDIDKIPYSQMWDSDSTWMKKVLAGQKIKGVFTYAGEGSLVKCKIDKANGF